MEWQTIETAPKDGTVILSWVDADWPEAIVWADYDEKTAEELGCIGYWRYADDLLADVMDGEIQPAHWMPLPPAPEGE